MNRYLLSLGSNCPAAPLKMVAAERWLRAMFTVVRTSGVYATRALNGVSPDYLNMLAEVDSDLSVEQMVETAKMEERAEGRTPESKLRGVVELDIDVIQVGNTILRPEEFARAYFAEGFRRLNSPEK